MGEVSGRNKVIATADLVSADLGSWLMPPGAEPVEGPGGCFSPAKWDPTERGNVYPVSPQWRIDVSGHPTKEVVLTTISINLMDKRNLEEGSFVHECPMGEPLLELQANLSMDPIGVSYTDQDHDARKGLNYRLSPGEQGVFYVTHDGLLEDANMLHEFELIVHYTSADGPGEARISNSQGDTNFTALGTCGIPTKITQGSGVWQDWRDGWDWCDSPGE